MGKYRAIIWWKNKKIIKNSANKLEELKWKSWKWPSSFFDPNWAEILAPYPQIWNSNLISKIEIILVTITWDQNWRTELEISKITTFYSFHQKYPYMEFLQNILFFNSSERQEPNWFQLCACKTELKCAQWNLENNHFYNFCPISSPNFGLKSPNIEFLKQSLNFTDNSDDKNHLYNNYGHQTWRSGSGNHRNDHIFPLFGQNRTQILTYI